jgi:hypothetical protein
VQNDLIARTQLTQYPAGFEPIRAQPLATLRAGIRLGDPAHFVHVFLAATFAPATDRAAVLDLLVQWVRFGREDQARVAMAALREVTQEPIAVGDRDGWLAWWSRRR